MFRKFFAVRYQNIGRDYISIDNFTLIQLKKSVQKPGDSYNCGVLCLKVCYCYVVKQAGWCCVHLQIAEQLILFNRIDEDAILQMDLNKTRRDIGTMLLTNSNNFCIYFCNAFLF